MLTKYRVNTTQDNYIEFSNLTDAQSFCIHSDYDVNTIETISYELPVELTPYKLTGKLSTPDELEGLDYDIKSVYQGFQKEHILVIGELRVTNYCRQYNPYTREYSDIAVKETRDYVRSTTGVPIYRIMGVQWFREDGSVGYEVQNKIKFYNPIEQLKEVVTRRSNLIDQAKAAVFFTLFELNNSDEVVSEAQSTEFLSYIGTDLINLYIQGKGEQLLTAIDNCTLSYITQAIKDLLHTILIYDYLTL